MKTQMKLMIADAPVHDVKMALAKEHHDREQTIRTLMATGRCRVVEDNCATHITVRVDTEFFTDIREKFPTTILMANVQLALAAGLDDHDHDRAKSVEDHISDALIYGTSVAPMMRRGVGKSELLGMGYGRGWSGVDDLQAVLDTMSTKAAALTVAVKRKFKKGLRP